VAGEISILLVSELDTCFSSVASCSAEMGKVLFVHVVLWMVPWFWVSPSMGKEPYTWRRPVPGWRQSEESVTLENRGYHFEEGKDFSLSSFGQGGMWRFWSMHIWQ